MRKVGLLTIVDYKNYGNRLQNYAAQQVLRSIGCDVTTIVNKPIKKTGEGINNSLTDRLKGKSILDLLKIPVNRINQKKRQKAFNEKVEAFRNFSNKNINESDFIIEIDSIPNNLSDSYDKFIVGSDQVWNPVYRKGSSIDFLTFAPSEKRIAYAPSFGIANIPDEYKEDYKEWLTEFKSLSVREDAGADIIRNLTNREAQVLVDPTVMLTKDQWLKIAKPHKLKPKSPFLLTYFLGVIPNDIKELINKLSKENNLEVVNLACYDQLERYAADPSEFIDYINSSHIFLTDSFHGAVFSIILEKQFIISNRVSKVPSMSSRIDTLLTKFELMDRKWESVKKAEDYFGAKFSHTAPIFERERSKAYEYLKNALEIEDAN